MSLRLLLVLFGCISVSYGGGVKIFLSIELVNTPWAESLNDHYSDGFLKLSWRVTNALKTYSVIKNDISSKVIQFSKGTDSILAKIIVKMADNKMAGIARKVFVESLKFDVENSLILGADLQVKKGSFIIHDIEKEPKCGHDKPPCPGYGGGSKGYSEYEHGEVHEHGEEHVYVEESHNGEETDHGEVPGHGEEHVYVEEPHNGEGHDHGEEHVYGEGHHHGEEHGPGDAYRGSQITGPKHKCKGIVILAFVRIFEDWKPEYADTKSEEYAKLVEKIGQQFDVGFEDIENFAVIEVLSVRNAGPGKIMVKVNINSYVFTDKECFDVVMASNIHYQRLKLLAAGMIGTLEIDMFETVPTDLCRVPFIVLKAKKQFQDTCQVVFYGGGR